MTRLSKGAPVIDNIETTHSTTIGNSAAAVHLPIPRQFLFRPVGILTAATTKSRNNFLLARVNVIAEAKLSNPEAILALSVRYILELSDVVALSVVGGVALQNAPRFVSSVRDTKR